MNRRFVFRLQSVLNLKEHQLKLAEQAVIEQERELQLQQSHLRELQEQKAHNRAKLFEFQKRMDFVMMDLAKGFEKGMDVKIAAQEEKLVEVFRELTKRREQLREVKTEHRTFEKLRENAAVQHQLDVLAHEQKQLDEVGVFRTAARKMKNLESP